jgi:hypothetical protein
MLYPVNRFGWDYLNKLRLRELAFRNSDLGLSFEDVVESGK